MDLPGAEAPVHVAKHQLHLTAVATHVLHAKLLLQLRLRLVGKRQPVYVHLVSVCGCFAAAPHGLVSFLSYAEVCLSEESRGLVGRREEPGRGRGLMDLPKGKDGDACGGW
jgi:hypothetical protein